MTALYTKLIVALSAMLLLMGTHKFGGLTPTPLVWQHTEGHELFDTASGNLEVGQYAVTPDGFEVNNATTTDASSTIPARIDFVKVVPKGMTQVHIIGTRYVDYFKNGSTIVAYPGDPTIGANLGKGGAIPTKIILK